MAKKRKAAKTPRELTKRQLSHYQQQKRRQRLIFGGGIFIIALVVLIVLVGWYIGDYRPLHRTVIRVNATEFNAGYYIDTLKISGKGQSPDYISSIADTAVKEIEQDELIRQGAQSLGITVSDDEVKNTLKNAGIPVNRASLDLVRSQMLQSKLSQDHFSSQVPDSAAQAHIMAMLLESESQASDVRTRLENSENFTALAAELSLNTYSKTNKGDLGWHPESIFAELLGSSVPGEYAFGSEAGVLSQPRDDEDIDKQVGYWLLRVVTRDDDNSAQVQAILLGSEEESQSVRARIEAGEDFATLAGQLSQYPKSKENGGELGDVNKGTMSAAFDAYVFNKDVATGTLSEPVRDDTVQTKGGYWLIDVVDRSDDRPLDGNDRQYLLSQAMNQWVAQLWADPSNIIDDSPLDAGVKAWAIEQATKG